MGDGRARLMQPLAFAFRQMNAMGKYAMVIHQSEALIDRRVVPVIGKQRFDPGNLARAFRKMGLHQRVGIGFQQLAGYLQLRFR